MALVTEVSIEFGTNQSESEQIMQLLLSIFNELECAGKNSNLSKTCTRIATQILNPPKPVVPETNNSDDEDNVYF